jgi:hypothetical protein
VNYIPTAATKMSQMQKSCAQKIGDRDFKALSRCLSARLIALDCLFELATSAREIPLLMSLPLSAMLGIPSLSTLSSPRKSASMKSARAFWIRGCFGCGITASGVPVWRDAAQALPANATDCPRSSANGFYLLSARRGLPSLPPARHSTEKHRQLAGMLRSFRQ